MKKNIAVVLTCLIMLVFISFSVEAANNSAFQNYRLAISSLKQKNLDETKQYLDQIVLDDLSYSEYLAKAIYLKSILLTSEIKSDLEIKEHILEGQKKIPLEDQDKREELKQEADSYNLAAQRKVDTLLGLANYLLSNLPPIELDMTTIPDVGQPNVNIMEQIEQGDLASEEQLNTLQRDLTLKKMNQYLNLTLGVKEFNNLFVIKAKQGDTLLDLADNYELPVSLLIEVNNHIDNPNLIYPGQKIYIPRVNSSNINYPSYFYYLSTVSYSANKERKEEINRLVVSAYQLTDNKNRHSVNYKEKAEELAEKMEVTEYQKRLEEQSDKIDSQNNQLEEIKEKYDQLLEELSNLKEDDENQSSESGLQLDEDGPNYNPDEDPLTY
ncbi:MAG: LysM peptidoglycan-binding domain-containing protein [Bacillota bacterium]